LREAIVRKGAVLGSDLSLNQPDWRTVRRFYMTEPVPEKCVAVFKAVGKSGWVAIRHSERDGSILTFRGGRPAGTSLKPLGESSERRH